MQVEFLIKTMFRPVLRGGFAVIDVKLAADNVDVNQVQKRLKSMVWSSGYASWDLDKSGRNTANYAE